MLPLKQFDLPVSVVADLANPQQLKDVKVTWLLLAS